MKRSKAENKAETKEEREKREAERQKQQETDVIVIDIGSGTIKAGWAGEDSPRCVIPTLVIDNHGQAMPASMLDSKESHEYLVGHDALRVLHQSTTSSLQAIYPVQRGKIVHWDGLIKLLEHIFARELRVDSSKYPVLVSNVPLSTRQSREQLALRMFRSNNLKVPSLCICNSSVLSLFATGKTRGVVLELGEGVTHAVPVFEGFALKHATLRLPVAGLDVTSHLMSKLGERGINFDDTHRDVVRDIKEKLCRVRLMNDDLKQYEATADEVTYELPDGRIIRIDDECRLNTSEVLFDPHLLGDEKLNADRDTVGVHQMCYNSILKCDAHLQKDLFQNIILSGGTSMLRGFTSRMQQEMDVLSDGNEMIEFVADSQRKYAAWIGGSIFGSLATFHDVKYTSSEHRADPTIVHRKYF